MVEHDDDHGGGRSHASTSPERPAPGVSSVECRSLRLPGAPEPAVGTLLCRHGGALHLVVVVKVALDMRSSPMEPVDPPPIHAADVYRGADVVVASDLVPGRARVDVTVDGHVRATGHSPSGELRARLALRQNGATVIDKALALRDDAGTGAVPLSYARATAVSGSASTAAMAPKLGFGPYGTDWPARQQFLSPSQRAQLQGPVMTLADDLDWRFFQAAPADQQIDELASDATVVLEGMSVDVPRLEAQLPALQPRGGIVGLARSGPGRNRDLTFRADSLHIHADQNVCVVSWRAVVELPATVPSLTVTVGIEPLQSKPAQRPSGTRVASSIARADGMALPFQPSAGPRLPTAAQPSPAEAKHARSGQTVGADEPAASPGTLPFWKTTPTRAAKRKSASSAMRGTLKPSSRPAPPSDPLPFDPDAKPVAASPPSPAELGPVLQGQTVDAEELRAMGMDALPFGQPVSPPPSTPEPASIPAPEPIPAPASSPEVVASPPKPDPVEVAPAPASASAKPEPKRPAQRVIRATPRDDDEPREPSPKKPPAQKKKPLRRVQKRTDANALLYKKKS